LIGSLVHLGRLARAGFVLAREGALGLVEPGALPPPARLALRLARLVERPSTGSGTARLSAALVRLGPSYVKFGQFLATRPDLVGVAAARDLEQLQDRMPPFGQAQAVAAIETALGRPLGELFISFGEPVAAASIAQVHRAVVATADGPVDVAVKVMRPGVRDRFARDLQAMRFAARLAERLVPDTRRLRPTEVVDTLARSVAIEMDFRLEAAAVSEMRENTRDDPGVRLPSLFWDLTDRDVLTTSWIEGVRLNNLEAIEAAGIDRVALARDLIQTFLRNAIRDGYFHADMHPGNLFVDREGRLVLVDFGIMGRLGLKERRFLAEILLGFIQRDYRRVAEVHFEAGYVPPHHAVDDFAQAIRAIGEPIHDRRADEISMARLLTLLFEVTALFDMRTRTELVMLQKTMVVVEGVARSLDPKLDMWRTAEPVVRDWIVRNLGPIGRLEEAGRSLRTLAQLVSDLPELAQRSERLVAKLERVADRGIDLSPRTLDFADRTARDGGRWTLAALWVIAVALVLVVLRS
jgi:ubiquinone biosynthesis protein